MTRGPQLEGERFPAWTSSHTHIIVAAVVVVAIAMRVYGLNGRFDYDGYDEGVYWQTLRAMSAGYGLYRAIFCSQPPVFPLSIYPFYLLFGSTISAARLGVAVLSLLGLAGAYLLGKVLAGRVGGVAALVIVVATPSYLQASQTLQAEGPATAFLFLTAGTALMWSEHPTGRKGLVLATSCGITLLLGIFTKLLDVTAIILVLVLALAWLWQIRREPRFGIGEVLWPVAGAAVAAVVVFLVVCAPFLSSLPAVVQQVLTFHIAARNALTVSESSHIHLLYRFLVENAVLSVGAVIGLVVAMLRRDWRIVPLIAWGLATFLILVIQRPLFSRHAIVLIPPLLAITALAWNGSRRNGALLTGLLPLAAILTGAPASYAYYHTLGIRAESSDAQRAGEIAEDLQRATTPDQWAITDAQFIAGLADRDTPPWLVDTSSVRINSGYLTLPELIEVASDPRVHVVLFATDRLASAPLAGFHSWVAQHYHPLRMYGAGIELWIR